jgi:hypothetical protein
MERRRVTWSAWFLAFLPSDATILFAWWYTSGCIRLVASLESKREQVHEHFRSEPVDALSIKAAVLLLLALRWMTDHPPHRSRRWRRSLRSDRVAPLSAC